MMFMIDYSKEENMKKSEARIIIWLSQVEPQKRNVTGIAHGLDITYNYVSKQLSRMKYNKLIRPHRLQTRIFYSLTEHGKAHINKAKEELRE